MQSILSIGFLLIIIPKVSEAKIIVRNPNAHRSPELFNAVVNIVKTCYGKSEATVGIIGRSDTALLKALWSDPIMPVILIDETENTQKNIRKLPKIEIFLINMITWLELQERYISVENLIWWNPEATYLIIDELTESTKNGNCVADNDNFVGRMTNMFNVKVLCFRYTKKIDIFSYSSRFHKTSSPWKFHRMLQQATRNKSNVYVFTRSYRDDDKLCVNVETTKNSTETSDWTVSSGETD